MEICACRYQLQRKELAADWTLIGSFLVSSDSWDSLGFSEENKISVLPLTGSPSRRSEKAVVEFQSLLGKALVIVTGLSPQKGLEAVQTL